MKKYPFVKQSSSKTCAVASLLMIMKYYKGHASQRYLEELTKTTKNGTSAFHLIEAAKELGFESKGLKINLSDLRNIAFPCIVHVTFDKSYNHYMVLYDIDFKNKSLIVADPASKISKWSFTEFEKIWNNIVITFVPVKSISIIHTETTLKDIIRIAFNSLKGSMLTIFILCFICIVLSMVSSFSFKIMLDSIENLDALKVIISCFTSLLLIEFFKNIFSFIRNKALILIGHKLSWNVTKDILKEIISLPYCYYRNHTTGDIVSRINDLKIVKEISSQLIILCFVDIPLMVISSIALLCINKTLFVIPCLTLLSIWFLNYLFNSIYKKFIKAIHEKEANTNNNIFEKVSGFETIKGLNVLNESINSLNEDYYDYSMEQLKLDKIYNIHSILKSLCMDIGKLVVFFVGVLLVLKEQLELSNLLVFNALFVYFINPVQNIADMATNIKEAKNALERVNELVIKKDDYGIIDKPIKGNIKYQNLTFSYDSMNTILNNINLNIKEKEKVLILGDSGAGKSTILKLLLKFYDIPRNQLFIDDIDINDYKKETLLNNICYISQNEILFTNSLLNNLKLGREIDNSEIEKMLDFCYIRDIFKNSNLGMYTLIEENGFNLSGGERQRIILGRSLLKKFNILIIDEGLNQVDISLERKILKNIFRKYSDKTIIVISHRKENMDLFNHVIKFKNKKIVEDLVYNAT